MINTRHRIKSAPYTRFSAMRAADDFAAGRRFATGNEKTAAGNKNNMDFTTVISADRDSESV